MCRYRLVPSAAQEAALRDHCAYARFVWNLAVEQHSHWHPGRAGAPGWVTMDRAGRWHLAFAVIPEPVPAPGNGQVVGIDRGVAVTAALSTGKMLHVPALTARERGRMRRLERKLARTVFRCTVCGFAGNADVNAARNIAAGHPTHLPIPLHSRGGCRDAGPVNREPQLLSSLTGRE